jgi:hypothetical protein
MLNTLLPADRQIADLTFKNNEAIGNTAIDRKVLPKMQPLRLNYPRLSESFWSRHDCHFSKSDRFNARIRPQNPRPLHCQNLSGRAN